MMSHACREPRLRTVRRAASITMKRFPGLAGGLRPAKLINYGDTAFLPTLGAVGPVVSWWARSCSGPGGWPHMQKDIGVCAHYSVLDVVV